MKQDENKKTGNSHQETQWHERRFRRKFILWIIIALILICVVYLVEESMVKKEIEGKIKTPSEIEEEVKNVIRKTVTGKVNTIYPNFIAIGYDRNEQKGIEYEMAFSLNKRVEIVNKENLSQIRVGDKVQITYDEIIFAGEGIERTRRMARTITFVEPDQ